MPKAVSQPPPRYEVTLEVGMLVQVRVEAASMEEAITTAEQHLRVSAEVKPVGYGPSGWVGDDALVAEVSTTEDNPGSPAVHFRYRNRSWVRTGKDWPGARVEPAGDGKEE